MAKTLGSQLAQETECDVSTFTSPHAVLAAAAEQPPDALIADLSLPEIDGLALIADLTDSDPDLTALVMTSSSDADGTARALSQVGPLCHVTKPCELSDLLPKLRAGLDRRALAKQLAATRAALHERDQALRASLRQVERTAAQLETKHTELKTATERLVAAEQLAAVGRVVTAIAHELGSQLALVGYAEAIKSRVADDAELVEFADVIVNAQKRLSAMVEEIRDFARGDRTELDREPAELSSIVEDALTILHYDRDVRLRNIEREYRAHPLVALHREKFSQVIINLVSNAVLATRPGDTIEIALWSEVDKGFCALTVTDHGTGMPPHVLDRLGEPFFTTRGDRGSGLGVGICMRIVEEHGGSVVYCSEEGEGTIARVRLPLLGADQA
jgi:signal transduction histidine kinase